LYSFWDGIFMLVYFYSCVDTCMYHCEGVFVFVCGLVTRIVHVLDL